MLLIIVAYFLVVNMIGFCLMALDKKKAIRHEWRIPEETLFLVAIIGGSAGSWLGMYVFRHKTKHISFVIGMPAILLLQAISGMILFFSWSSISG